MVRFHRFGQRTPQPASTIQEVQRKYNIQEITKIKLVVFRATDFSMSSVLSHLTILSYERDSPSKQEARPSLMMSHPFEKESLKIDLGEISEARRVKSWFKSIRLILAD